MIPVILSGGSGSRLWPVSRQSFPKQFCELLDESLYTKTLKRLLPLGSPWTVTVRELNVLTERSLKENGVPVEQVIYEPFGKNTAPAIAVLCKVFEMKGWADEVVGIFPADHLIDDEAAFHQAVRVGGVIANDGHVVTLGVHPTYPATAYGYIETTGPFRETSAKSFALRATGFREKPNESTARDFIVRGGFYWNAGMFIFKVSKMADLIRQFVPDIGHLVDGLKSDLGHLDEIYQAVRSISIDYAVMERLPSHVCIPCSFTWNDLGSWDAIAEILKPTPDTAENLVEVGNSADNFVYPIPKKTYGLVGVEDLIVVDTQDALLIAKKGESERVKEVVETLKKGVNAVATQHQFEVRPWGRFQILSDSMDYKSKTITVDPGAQLSYQSHAKRAEHWVIVKGAGEVVLDDEIIPVQAGQHVYIPMGTKHRIRNTSQNPLEFVEVQVGTYFGEDDIVRYQDEYKRKTNPP